MTTFTILAFLFVCAVGEVSGNCYSDWRTCRSACSSCNGGYCDWGACSAGVQIRPLVSACRIGCGTACSGVRLVETRTCGGAVYSRVAVPAVRTAVRVPVRVAVRVVPARWTGWSGFSACSVRCGTGTQTRTRTCIPGTYGAVCVGPSIQTRACHRRIVNSYWTGFSAWSSCSARCGAGTQTRTRRCVPGNACGARCVGPSRQTRACYGGACVRTVVVNRVVQPAVRVVRPAVRYVGGVGGCSDINSSCGAWGAAGFCNSYAGYMSTSCCNSCQGLISAYIKEKPEQLKWTPEKYVEVMTEELKSRK